MSNSIAAPRLLARFTCLGDKCEDTCCKGWGMQVDSRVIERCQREAPELLEAFTGAEDARLMKRDALTDYCIKFEKGLCGIQKQYGTDFLGDACHFYPRMTRTLGKTALMAGALSCPEITRLSLFADDAFMPETITIERAPHSLTDYLPESLTTEQAIAIHNAFLQAALDERTTAAHNMARLHCVATSLEKIPAASWPDAVPFYIEYAEGRLPAPVPAETDPFFLLQALSGLIAAAKKGQQERLMQNVRMIESALHVTIQWDSMAIAHLPDSLHAAQSLQQEWNDKWHSSFEPVLRRYLAAQLSLALFPFAGFADTLSNRMGIIGVRFATLRLALMSACRTLPTLPDEAIITRIVQSLSRFLDHLAGSELSLRIYNEAGWMNSGRLRALVGD